MFPPIPAPDVHPTAAVPVGTAAIVGADTRAPNGWTRFRIRATSTGAAVLRYILAQSQSDAEELYLLEQNLPADAVLTVTALPD